jgi:hypothetical protein
MHEAVRRAGTVVDVIKDRGYFFILYEGRRIFCHVSNWSELEMPLVNDRVSFEVGPAKKPKYTFEAVNVQPAYPNAGLKALSVQPQSEVRQ